MSVYTEPLPDSTRRFLRKHTNSASVEARAETWHLHWWADGREDGVDAVSVEVERRGHNFAASLTAAEAGALIDALLELLPDARGHAKSLAAPSPIAEGEA